jgi:DNA-binding transcriptional MocR family regulator
MDAGGIVPDGLEHVIKTCISTSGRAPKLMYIVPHCQNPTGSTLTMQRKREIYNICSKYNVVILEDDPYCFLQFPSEGTTMPGTLHFAPFI